MPAKPKSIILDSWSVMALFQDEPAGIHVANLIADASEAGTSVYMTVVNAGEVWYIMARKFSESKADEAIKDLQNAGVQFTDIDWELTRLAAAFKARGRISYADAYAAALAKQMKCDLVTGDPEFKTVDGEIKIMWLSRDSH